MIDYTIIFTDEAAEDIKEARKWYNLQQKGLGKRFVDEIKNVVQAIERNPFFASVKYLTIRTAACKVFRMQFIMM